MKHQRPLIGITCGEIVNKVEPWSPTTFGQSRTYVESIINAGGAPLLLPLTTHRVVLEQLIDMLDGLYLAGGNDLDPSLYHQTPYKTDETYSSLRDTTEITLLERALARRIPILGVCRGMQLMNVHFGGSLYQDIPHDVPNALDHNASTKLKSLVDLSHTLRLQPGSRIAQLLETEKIGANAHHHQAVRTLGAGLWAVAWAADGIIEALEMPEYPFLIGVQSHPESLASVEPKWARLFEAFVASAIRGPFKSP
ncbi:MAG TPA: gamma-glutamyl-gamma-aminobutyrate hydrolase family protein [Candidatus Saccharimonadales bacterium]|nr:gamma-glutamyl-gamma-aminobutyrate hydrolase family protein [Candidatus Saccharimonadales bacterium]